MSRDLVRVPKEKALSLYEKGVNIYLYASAEMVHSVLAEPMLVNHQNHYSLLLATDTFEQYNCVPGKRALFYIKKPKEEKS